jgi:hypothetical protein
MNGTTKDTPMIRSFLMLGLFLVPTVSTAQDSSRTVVSPTLETAQYDGPVISDTPTARELNRLFMGSSVDLRRAVQAIARKGEAVIPALTELLIPSSSTSTLEGEADSSTPSGDLSSAIEALEVLGTDNAVALLVRVAESHPDVGLRGVALSTINAGILKRCIAGGLVPAKDFPRVMIVNLGRTEYIPSERKTLGQIAGEGVTAWLGLDFGDPMFKRARKITTTSEETMPSEAFAQKWWGENESRLAWNPRSGHFEVNQAK